MKKIIIILFIAITLVGCNSEDKEEVQLNNYYSIVEQIIDNDSNNSLQIPFDYKLEVTKIENGYEWVLKINNPQISMYNIQAVAVDRTQDLKKVMFPSLGVFDDEVTNLVPNQVDKDKGYYGGIALSGVSESADIKLDIIVSYNKLNNATFTNVFFTVVNKPVIAEE